jgi:tetratricopeptide (TPR) repeat protein
MHYRTLAVALFVLSFPMFGGEVLQPADYLTILTGSKLTYNIRSEPSQSPVEELKCPRRDERTRVVVENGEKKLAARDVKLEALKLILEGEQHYRAERMKEAREKYAAAIATDPRAISAYLYDGDALLIGSDDPAGALEQYRKGIALDPTLPAGHFFASTAYAKLGRLKEARDEVVQALMFYPGYESVWKTGTRDPDFWGVRPMVRHPFEPPTGVIGRKAPNGVDVFTGKDGEWIGYATCKAVWANEPRFANKHMGSGGWSLEEERACLMNHLLATLNATGTRLKKERKGGDAIAALPARERHIYEVSRAKLLDGYILFEIIGQQCPMAMSLLKDDLQKELEKYIRTYVVIADE